MGIKYTDERIYIILEDFFVETFLSILVSISTWLNQPPCLIDPFCYLQKKQSSRGTRYLGGEPLFIYLSEQKDRGKGRYNYLPS